MKNRIGWIVSGVALAALLLVVPAQATEDLAKTADAKCTVCHDKPGSKLLTSKGKYFELKRSFEGHEEVIRKYRKCTKCHAEFPGSQKLTKKGQRLEQKGVTMDHVILEPAE